MIARLARPTKGRMNFSCRFCHSRRLPQKVRQRRNHDADTIALSNSEIAEFVAFWESITGTTLETPPFGIPKSVPSGLPLD